MRFAKGHGTGNDFVLLPDVDGELALTPGRVAALCDRRFGVGGDGVLRVVRADRLAEGRGYADAAEWFMDYHNADGSIGEMCGNGVRVFARYLLEHELVRESRFTVGTRAGLVGLSVDGDAVTATMARPRLGGTSTAVLHGVGFTGTTVDVGNPHLVCRVDQLSTLDLTAAPDLDADVFPKGANVEFVAATADPLHVRMRVYERGSGETLSCGTGACAVAAVALRDAGLATGRVAVEVPGGRLTITLDDAGCGLTGPAVLVAEGDLLI
jgi:diaminopimelate epimerase